MKKLKVGILGATGMVGQRFIGLLANHPWFSVAELGASESSVGKRYKEAMKTWLLPTPCPSHVEDMIVKACDPAEFSSDFIFSALGGDAAGLTEELFAKAGFPVVSTSKDHRWDPDVPMVIPEVNGEHIGIIDIQRKKRGYERGFIAVKSNCSLQSFVIALHPLYKKFGIREVILSTLQAVSGAGYPGVSSLDIVDNVLPYISGEEEKTEEETLKIFGEIVGEEIVKAKGMRISAHCHRVPVQDGHLAAISVKFEKNPTREEILQLWKEFRAEPQELKLPSAPDPVILYREELDRPQPWMDRDAGGGMAVTCGRLRPCRVFDWRFECLSHNIIRGAAGGSVLLAELLKAKGYL